MTIHIPSEVYDGFDVFKALEIAQVKCSQNGLEQPAEGQAAWFGIYQTMLRLEVHLKNSETEMWHYKVKAQQAERMVDNQVKTIAKLREKTDAICKAVRNICQAILDTNVTHGQKNGMVLLLEKLVQRWATEQSEASDDIPF